MYLALPVYLGRIVNNGVGDMIWTCPTCALSFPVKRDEFPVHCSCGVVDDGGEFVTTLGKAGGFARAAWGHVTTGGVKCTTEQINARLEVCRGCAYYSGGSCRLCGCRVNSSRFLNKLAWADQSCPAGLWPAVERADVLMVFPEGSDPAWLETRGQHVVDYLSENGKTAAVECIARTPEALAAAVRLREPRVVINRAFFFSAEIIEAVAPGFPDCQFVNVNHSSHAYTQSEAQWVRQQAEAIRLAAELDNVWYGHVDERDVFDKLGLTRCLWFPNVVTIPTIESRPPNLSNPLCSLAGRWHLIKNQTQQMIAMALADVRALLVIKTQSELAEIFARSVGLRYEVMPWGSWKEWNKAISGRVAVGMQASFSESFNYVALEHLIAGRPVVGSSAVRYLPDAWKADADDPEDIARVIRLVLDNYKEASEQAREVAEVVTARQNSAVLEQLDRITREK
jgi:hypothetical protein